MLALGPFASVEAARLLPPSKISGLVRPPVSFRPVVAAHSGIDVIGEAGRDDGPSDWL